MRSFSFVIGPFLAAMAALLPSAHADSIAYWNFNGDSMAVSSGSGTLAFNGSTGVSYTSGTTLNAPGGTLGVDALTIAGAASLANNGKSLLFTISTVGLQNLVLTYATQGTTTGFNSQAWAYSTDDVNFTNFTAVTSIPSSFAVKMVDFSSVTALNNAPNVYIQLTFSGATNASGNNRIDNVNFAAASPVPLPSALPLGLSAIALIPFVRSASRKILG